VISQDAPLNHAYRTYWSDENLAELTDTEVSQARFFMTALVICLEATYLNYEEGLVPEEALRSYGMRGLFEIDAAYPQSGEIRVAVDVKRFESERDMHKRGDEITQKARHLKDVHPDSRFYAVIYYPFPAGHDAVRRRYQGQGIDEIFFADSTEESVARAALAIIEDSGLGK